jgi:hypothetical protein
VRPTSACKRLKHRRISSSNKHQLKELLVRVSLDTCSLGSIITVAHVVYTLCDTKTALTWYYHHRRYKMAMQAALAPFEDAYATRLSQPIAEFLSPVAPAHDPGRLYDFYRASNDEKIIGDVRYALKYNKRTRMGQKESEAWVDIIVGYWRAVKQIILADEAANQGRDSQYLAVYDAWKDLTSSFIKHISGGALPAYAIFTLYFTANHLRKIAIKADNYLAKAKPATSLDSFGDDIVPQTKRSEKLEEAARVFNRIFALCLGDRWANTYPSSLLLSLTHVQKPRCIRVSQVGCLLYSQSSIQDLLQGTHRYLRTTMLCADSYVCS